jgi:hypothetical protein
LIGFQLGRRNAFEERDTRGLEKRPTIPIPSRGTVEMLLDFARTGRESPRALAPGHQHPVSKRAKVAVPNQRVVLKLSDHLQTHAAGTAQGALRGGADLTFVVEHPHNLEVLTLRQWLLDVDDAGGSQNPTRFGERLCQRRHGDVVKAVEKSHDVCGAILNREVFRASGEIAFAWPATDRRAGNRIRRRIDAHHARALLGEEVAQRTRAAADVYNRGARQFQFGPEDLKMRALGTQATTGSSSRRRSAALPP